MFCRALISAPSSTTLPRPILIRMPCGPSARRTSASMMWNVSGPPGATLSRMSTSFAMSTRFGIVAIGHVLLRRAAVIGDREPEGLAAAWRSPCRCARAPRMPTVWSRSVDVGERIGALLRPAPGAQIALGRGELAHGHQQQAQRGIGDFLGEDVRRVGDDHAMLAGPVGVDGVIADAEIGDDLELGQAAHQRARPASHGRPWRRRGCGGRRSARKASRSVRRQMVQREGWFECSMISGIILPVARTSMLFKSPSSGSGALGRARFAHRVISRHFNRCQARVLDFRRASCNDARGRRGVQAVCCASRCFENVICSTETWLGPWRAGRIRWHLLESATCGKRSARPRLSTASTSTSTTASSSFSSARRAAASPRCCA